MRRRGNLRSSSHAQESPVAITDPDVDRYLFDLVPERPGPVAELEKRLLDGRFPTVGPVVGRLLHQVTAMLGVRRALELGSGPGYAAWWIATALPEDGELVCTEWKEEHAAAAAAFLAETGIGDRVRFETGEALEVLERLPGTFDLVFCDIDKQDYPRALDLVVPRLNPGGVLMTDNVLWSGDVARVEPERKDTALIQEYNRRAVEHPELVTTILPVRDGVAVSWKRP
jgi:caffeoyl-CoA O-methyltransferase